MVNHSPEPRQCRKCGETKPITDYYRQREGQWRWECKVCHLEGRAAWRAANRPKVFKLYYGVTEERYAELLASQGGVCAICRKPETEFSANGNAVSPLQLDHDHRCCTGWRRCGECVRGLLCGRCNRALGLFQDDPDLLAAAARYLTESVA